MKNSQEIEQLWMEYKKNRTDSVKKQLIEHYAPLIKIIASKFKMNNYQGLEFDDLIHYGVIGLVDAIEKFDIEKNIKFESYATLRIRGEIIDNIRRTDWAPRCVRKNQKDIATTINSLEESLGRVPSDIEVAEKLGITLAEYVKQLEEINLLQILSVDAQFQMIDTSPQNIDSTEEVVERQWVISKLKETIEKLPERDQLLLHLYYFEELTFKEIGIVLGVSDSRVSQLHVRCIGKLRALLEKHNITCPI